MDVFSADRRKDMDLAFWNAHFDILDLLSDFMADVSRSRS